MSAVLVAVLLLPLAQAQNDFVGMCCNFGWRRAGSLKTS